MPKTAGTSFLYYLRDVLGVNRIFHDTIDQPMELIGSQPDITATAKILSGINQYLNSETPVVIHGHFLATKYNYLFKSETKYHITWFRDPAKRLLSHYNYWHKKPFGPNKLRTNTINISFEEFVEQPELQNVYAMFLDGKLIKDFAFVGIVEEYDKYIKLLTNMFNFEHEQAQYVNKATIQAGELTPEIVKKIKRLNKRDYYIYDKAVTEAQKIYDMFYD
jgi:hypothetical protein